MPKSMSLSALIMSNPVLMMMMMKKLKNLPTLHQIPSQNTQLKPKTTKQSPITVEQTSKEKPKKACESNSLSPRITQLLSFVRDHMQYDHPKLDTF